MTSYKSFNETTTLLLTNESTLVNDSTLINELSLDNLCKNFHLIVFLCIIFVLIVSANISVILQLSCSKNRHSRMSFFLLNLAYADLFVGIIIVTRDIIEKSCIPFRLGSIGCRLISFIQGTIAYNSSYVLVCVAIDRLNAIIRPMDVRTASSAFRYSLISASWFISMTFASAQLYLRDIDTIRDIPICGNRSDVQNWNAYVYFLFISLYLAPLIVMTASYVIIIVIIWQKSSVKIEDGLSNKRNEKSRIRRLLSSKKSTSNDDHQIESSIRDVRSLGVIPRAKIKTIKMTLVIVIAFTACWSPYFILMIMHALNLIQHSFLIRVTSSLCYMNSLANPLIYWLFATNFCLRLREKSGCHHQLKKITLTTNGADRRRCSILETRHSIGSVKHQRQPSEDYHRAHNPRIPLTPTVPLPRHLNCRTSISTPNYTQTNKRIVQQQQQQNSQASLLYDYQQHHL
ncbi:unnamed protein product [Adineta steineri]|uniref:G-protein coupled receptors family 1 profile domain-containing protein n=2 Tax=Adineta steineri TaxID=433720 RepID=A0A815H6G1_9BILA|nr:unnamed protein product [Adineta steineri]CAF1346922.1 unnamed protein product [Adineta steineri]